MRRFAKEQGPSEKAGFREAGYRSAQKLARAALFPLARGKNHCKS
jgi:hypothetical protein